LCGNRYLLKCCLCIIPQLNRGGSAALLHHLAGIDYAERRYDDARCLATKSLEISQEIGDRSGIAVSAVVLGRIARQLQLPNEAFDLITLGVLILTETGHANQQTVQKDLTNLIAEDGYGGNN
jgi:hypothetical protein